MILLQNKLSIFLHVGSLDVRNGSRLCLRLGRGLQLNILQVYSGSVSARLRCGGRAGRGGCRRGSGGGGGAGRGRWQLRPEPALLRVVQTTESHPLPLAVPSGSGSAAWVNILAQLSCDPVEQEQQPAVSHAVIRATLRPGRATDRGAGLRSVGQPSPLRQPCLLSAAVLRQTRRAAPLRSARSASSIAFKVKPLL